MPRRGRGNRNHLRLHLLALLLLLLPQHLQARRRRRQLDIAAGKIRGLQPVGQREKFGGGQNPRRFARESQFRRARLRDFRIRIAQRAAKPLKPLKRRLRTSCCGTSVRSRAKGKGKIFETDVVPNL